MKGKLKIFYVSSEVFPFTQLGELGEVAGALPKYLKNLGHDIRVMMPNYKQVNERKYVLRDVIRLQGLNIEVGQTSFKASAKSAFIPDSKVQVYFLDNKHFFDRNGLYSDGNTGEEFADNAERYTFFAKGCLETLKLLYWQPDIIHCNGWQTALIPTLLKSVYRDDSFFHGTRTLLSVDNFSHAGVFGADVIKRLGLPETLVNGQKSQSTFSFLESGLQHADLLNTFSQDYAEEMEKEDSKSDNLRGLLKKRKSDIHAVANGIDDVVWNPETDELIPFQYTQKDLSGKVQNKQKLVERFDLPFSADAPVLSVIANLAEKDGMELLLDALPSLMDLDVQVVMVGTANEHVQKSLLALQKKVRQKLGLEFSYSPELAHLIAAGSDFYLMPSNSEPCGLFPLYSLAYGTIPIVGNIGRLADTFKDYEEETGSGTGFVIDKVTSSELLKTIKRALKAYQNHDAWTKLVQNAMKQNVSWKSSVRNYVKLYQKLLNVKNNRN